MIKKAHFIKFLLLAICLISFNSCKKDNDVFSESKSETVKVKFNLNLISNKHDRKLASTNMMSGSETVPFTESARIKIFVFEDGIESPSLLFYVTNFDFVVGSDNDSYIELPVGKKYTYIAYTDNIAEDLPDFNYAYHFIKYEDRMWSNWSLNDLTLYYILSKQRISKVDNSNIINDFIPSNFPYYYAKFESPNFLSSDQSKINNYAEVNLNLKQMNFGLNVQLDLSDIEHTSFEVPVGVKLSSSITDNVNDYNKNHIRLYDGALVFAPYINNVTLNDREFTEHDGQMIDDRKVGYSTSAIGTMEFECYTFVKNQDLSGKLFIPIKVNYNDNNSTTKNFEIPNIPLIPGARHTLKLKAIPNQNTGSFQGFNVTIQYDEADLEDKEIYWVP